MDILQNPTNLWLIAGGILIIMEFFLFSGVGFAFAGLGALTVGLLLETGVIATQLASWLVFLLSTLLWALLLWKKLANFKMNRHQQPFSDMIGHKAVLLTPLEPGQIGQARWSGTIMKAKLSEHHKKPLSED